MAYHPTPSDVELQKDVDALHRNGGNRSAAARERGMPRKSYTSRLKLAEKRFGIVLRGIADGRVGEVKAEVFPLPKKGHVARYIFTSAQNNTLPHPAWANLKAYAEWLGERPRSSCRLIVGTFSYALDAYGAKAVKRNTFDEGKADEDLWYAPELEPFILDSPVEIAHGLMWAGEMNILPTARHPLTGLETYNGRKSNIVPHAKIAMESVPSMPGEGTKFNFTTGTITQRNYIQKLAGIKAEQGHAYGGTLVEVNSEGSWWVRQLHLDANGYVYDVGPSGYAGVRVCDGMVEATGPHEDQEKSFVEAIVWADAHTAEMERWVRELGWGEGGMLDVLRPRHQVLHDLYSHRSRTHHEMRDFHAMYAKHATGAGSVEHEVEGSAEFLNYSFRPWCRTTVVPSNHDRHLTRWLNEEDPRKDLPNARYHNHLQGALLAALDRGEEDFNVLSFALAEKGSPAEVHFLREDESFVLLHDIDGGIECGLHGDRGPGGSRGSTRGLARLGRAVIKGHDHTAAIRDNVYSVGACSLKFNFMKGPSAHSVSHVVVFENGKRQIITMWKGRWRA
jgi:hypothetical protein